MQSKTLRDSIQTVSVGFDYEADDLRIFDSWSVLTPDAGRYRGDCEDFVLTVFWHLSGRDLATFLWHVLITHQYRLYRVRDTNGNSHVVGSYQDQWFDNWTLGASNRDQFVQQTGHDILHMYPGPLIALYLLIGLVVN